MRTIAEYIASGMPGLLLVERDVKYSRLIIPDILGQITTAEPRPFLEWTISLGWGASREKSKDLLTSSGLRDRDPVEDATGIPLSMIPAKSLQQFRDWLTSRRAGEAHGFMHGVVVLQDMYLEEVFNPYMVRIVGDVIDAMLKLQGVAIFVAPVAPKNDSIIRSLLCVVDGEVEPVLRYGRLARGFLHHIRNRRPLAEGEDDREPMKTVSGLLAGLSLSDAELAVRLTLMDKSIIDRSVARRKTDVQPGAETAIELLRRVTREVREMSAPMAGTVK